METQQQITRREALQRVAIFLGGTLAASTVAGAMAENAFAGYPVPGTGYPGDAWSPRTLTADQYALASALVEHIIPRTDTPGAKDAGVPRFLDDLLTDHYRAPERSRVIAGLQGVDVRALRKHKKKFLATTRAQQIALLTEMDREAYPAGGAIAQQAKKQEPPPRDPQVGPGSGGTGSLAQPTAADVDGATEEVKTEIASGWFWRRLKEITLVGYYTSQPGATKELHVNPMGIWKGDMPYHTGDRAWA
ncbi:MAG: gluconate 2-dehydrogenase subunit 3 family protein [Gemmatimonadaceae bacterium]|nr:gluconate 2-dehydrogenase subunit 3 family protein [Gemmatimonadaceae bacterium]NUQ92406.1 gluconate 2-dehydrogenase subunit 3 family protein [Gemmatimonadaceae bacterium]NUR18286.1 gluconate 2-dehydrogenase subunit 3 family protein [Gemmatimonadaceae bacterium]NUS97216.1 gluconate 2-dehydrogenase subunit 3 family protein [Gemmatimonadaceae bacterium]